MQTDGAPNKGGDNLSTENSQNDQLASKNKSLNIFRSNRRKSIEDNIVMPNAKVAATESRIVFGRDTNNGATTERTMNNKLNMDDEVNIEEAKEKKPRAMFNRSQASTDLFGDNAPTDVNSSQNRLPNNRVKRYSPSPDITYKKYVGDINSIKRGGVTIMKQSLPSKLDLPATHPALMKSIESQKLKRDQRIMEEDEEIFDGDIEITVDSIQSHIKLILRLIKATTLSLDEYKKDWSSLRQEIFQLRQKLIDDNETVLNELNPELMKNYRALKREMKNQKTDTDLKYQELLKLKKGNAQLQQMLDNEVAVVDSLQSMVYGLNQGE